MNSVEDLHQLGNLFEDFVYKKDLKRKQIEEDSTYQHSPPIVVCTACVFYQLVYAST